MPNITKVIHLKHATVHFFDDGTANSIFPDGTTYGAHPHDTPHYREIAWRCGYEVRFNGGPLSSSADIGKYCQEHEFFHHYIVERLNNSPSQVLWPLAHGAPVDKFIGLGEEALVQMMQRWVRANERPILSRVNWDDLKRDALELLGG